MGNRCTKNDQNNPMDEIDPKLRTKKRQMQFNEADTNSLGRPDLGIYESRNWKMPYIKWLSNDCDPKFFPGEHPDPSVTYNQEENMFYWND